MIIVQEEKSPIDDYVINHNFSGVFDKILEMSSRTPVETEELKVFVSQTEKLLKDFEKHIEKVEKEETKAQAKAKFNALVSKGGFDE